MNRLTERTSTGMPKLMIGISEQEAVFRLVDYEDLEFSPEELKFIIDNFLDEDCFTCIGCEMEPANASIKGCKSWVLSTHRRFEKGA